MPCSRALHLLARPSSADARPSHRDRTVEMNGDGSRSFPLACCRLAGQRPVSAVDSTWASHACARGAALFPRVPLARLGRRQPTCLASRASRLHLHQIRTRGRDTPSVLTLRTPLCKSPLSTVPPRRLLPSADAAFQAYVVWSQGCLPSCRGLADVHWRPQSAPSPLPTSSLIHALHSSGRPLDLRRGRIAI